MVLLSGLLAGAGLTVIFDLDEKATEIFGLKPKPTKSKSIMELRDRVTDRFAAEMDLSEAQKNRVRDVLTKYFASSLDRRKKMLDDLTEVLAPVLSESKRAEWEQLKAEKIKIWEKGMAATQPSE